jgi:hypothetical protein
MAHSRLVAPKQQKSAHCPSSAQEMMANNEMNVVLYHPYSPDLAPCDFVVFSKTQTALNERFRNLRMVQKQMQSSGKVMSANALYNGMVGLSAPIRGGLF